LAAAAGFAAGFAAAGFSFAGFLAAFFAAFFAGFFAAGFFAAAFFAAFFAAGFFAAGFLAAFFAAGFLATFLAAGFLAAFFTAGFLAAGFFAAGFFAVAMMLLLHEVSKKLPTKKPVCTSPDYSSAQAMLPELALMNAVHAAHANSIRVVRAAKKNAGAHAAPGVFSGGDGAARRARNSRGSDSSKLAFGRSCYHRIKIFSSVSLHSVPGHAVVECEHGFHQSQLSAPPV
jgi:MFS family permease